MLSLKRCQKELTYWNISVHTSKRDHKKIYYNAVIKPGILYSANIRTSSCKENLNNIFRLQKRAARIILDTESRSHSLPLFNTLNLLPFYQDIYVNRCTLILKRTLSKTPEYLKSMLQLNSDVHSSNTHFSKLNLCCPMYNNSTEGGQTFSVRSVKDWNNLGKSLKNSKDTKSFRKSLIHTLLERQRNQHIWHASLDSLLTKINYDRFTNFLSE